MTVRNDLKKQLMAHWRLYCLEIELENAKGKKQELSLKDFADKFLLSLK